MSKETEQHSISDTIQSLRYGTLDEELGEKLHELVSRVDASQRAGSITLTLKVKPGGPGRIEITDEIKVALPKEPKGSSIMFVLPSGKITRTDPRQLEIEGLKQVVDQETGEIRTIEQEKPPLRSISK